MGEVGVPEPDGRQPDGGRGGVQAVVPVRGLPAGKARLARLLTVDQRNRLVRAMLSDVVRALQGARRVDDVTIISRDAAARRIADQLGVAFLHQPPQRTGLNEALREAQRHFARADALLIVPADLPLVRPADFDALIDAAASAPAVALAAAEDGGTNGLCLRPASVIAPSFGPDSAARHARAAEAAGAGFTTLRSERWALDIDWPEDLARLLALAGGAELETMRCLHAPGFPSWGSSPG
ncbi:MAG: 2-phospho-L-lactate guanylyltransferase [Chloroflexi bacterium]|nr:MAG: 2-phospho-L-lactate guanylyltransferase [Chloroflexota bacterium]